MILFLFVISAASVSAQTMKFAVPSDISKQDSLICQELGRAPFFLLFDHSGMFLKAIKNPATHQPGGISRTVVALLVDNGINVVIADSIGDKMKKALTDQNIQFIKKSGSVHDAITAITQK